MHKHVHYDSPYAMLPHNLLVYLLEWMQMHEFTNTTCKAKVKQMNMRDDL
jgi:hypothetical protein